MPENKIRQGQLIAPFGIGEMVDMPGDLSLIIAGTGIWDEVLDKASQDLGKYYDPAEFRIDDEKRLAGFLGVDYFVKPPVFRPIRMGKKVKNGNIQIPAYRFPQLHYCLKCFRIHRFSLDHIGIDERTGKTFFKHQDGRSKDCNGNFIPLRFVAVCSKGHIQDIPIVEWVHGNKGCTGSPVLWYDAKGGADNLGGIKIRCSTCSTVKSLAGITAEWALSPNPNSENDSPNRLKITCKGARPWLGESPEEALGCGEPLRVLIKGASNTYFPSISSSLFLPSGNGAAYDYLDRLFIQYESAIKEVDNDNDGAGVRNMVGVLYTINRPTCDPLGIDESLFKRYFQKRLNPAEKSGENDSSLAAEHYRFEEFERLTKTVNNSRELKTREIDSARYSLLDKVPNLRNLIEKVVLVEKLRETRALSGFTRYRPENNETQDFRKSLLSMGDVNWLPANIVRGEGIFIKFNDEVLRKWAEREDVKAHFVRLSKAYGNSWFGSRADRRPVTPTFVAIHTLSHLLVNKLCFNCGYGSSSLRERIYCNLFNENEVMNGLLIYTASGDSEGSLGGLVKQGNPGYLDQILIEAIEDAKWCSADPVCSTVGVQNGQGPENINGAACHNCSLVPETSCEEFNLLLDRTFLIGKLDKIDLGLFSEPI